MGGVHGSRDFVSKMLCIMMMEGGLGTNEQDDGY